METHRLRGMLMFTGRWFVQLAASKSAGKPVMPLMFWYMSIAGSLMLLGYFTFGKNDSVGILSNLFPFLTASYNLYLEFKNRPRRHDLNRTRAPFAQAPSSSTRFAASPARLPAASCAI